MIYEWKCKQCGTLVEVTRIADQYQIGPCMVDGKNEILCGHDEEDYTRIIGTTSIPFEHLRDKGVFERTHWLPDHRI